MKKFLSNTKKYVPLFSIITFALFLISIILHLIIVNNVAFADFFNYNLSAPTRAFMSYLTVIFPFSVAEIVVFASPIILGLLIFIAIKCGKKGKTSSIRYLLVLLSVVLLIFILFVWTYSSGYHTSRVEDKMGLDRSGIGAEDIYNTTKIFIDELNLLAPDIEYDSSGASVMPYSYTEMSEKICTAYERFTEKHDILRTYYSRIKPLIISEPMTYSHLSGIYTFMSGEANVNVNYPDFIVASTSAHEMAHQRGIAREDEANFISFAVLLESDDPFLKYSAYLDIFSNISNALYGEDKELYSQLMAGLDGRVVKDMISYSKFFEKYADSRVSEVVDSVNDSYLQANGQEMGTKSYEMVTEIVCAYLLNKTK